MDSVFGCVGVSGERPGPMIRRVRVRVSGQVLDVGFRPFVGVVARRLALEGWVAAEGDDVVVEAQGIMLERFLDELQRFAPPLARIDGFDAQDIPVAQGPSGFVIRDPGRAGSA